VTDLPQDKREAATLLEVALRHLRRITRDEAMMVETPVEVQAAIESAQEAIGSALRQLSLEVTRL
jgi:hypothetical protein